MKDHIKEHWNQIASKLCTGPTANMRDQIIVKKENETLLAHISHKETILDVGCGNGTSTLEIATTKNVKILGIDYSEKMIKSALINLENAQIEDILLGQVEFRVQDITKQWKIKNQYDKIISKRAIINLPNRDTQIKVIKSLAKLLKSTGLYLMIEDTIQGWKKLNELRKEWELPEIPMPWHNNYLDEAKIIKETENIYELIDIVNFCSTYYIGSRFVHPLLLKILNIDREPEYEAKINYLFSELSNYGDYGFQKLFIFKKR